MVITRNLLSFPIHKLNVGNDQGCKLKTFFLEFMFEKISQVRALNFCIIGFGLFSTEFKFSSKSKKFVLILNLNKNQNQLSFLYAYFMRGQEKSFYTLILCGEKKKKTQTQLLPPHSLRKCG